MKNYPTFLLNSYPNLNLSGILHSSSLPRRGRIFRREIYFKNHANFEKIDTVHKVQRFRNLSRGRILPQLYLSKGFSVSSRGGHELNRQLKFCLFKASCHVSVWSALNGHNSVCIIRLPRLLLLLPLPLPQTRTIPFGLSPRAIPVSHTPAQDVICHIRICTSVGFPS